MHTTEIKIPSRNARNENLFIDSQEHSFFFLVPSFIVYNIFICSPHILVV